jgi:MSHA pilin protein MshD
MFIDAQRRRGARGPFPTGARQRGVTLLELIVFMVIVSVGVVGLLSVTNATVRFSSDPMVRKQMVTIAESLLNEVLQQPFTYCDPDDASFSTAQSTADCTGGAAGSQDKNGGALTTPTPVAESRYGAASTQFDNVADYGGASSAGGGLNSPIDDVSGANAMAGYTASVAVTRAGVAFSLPVAQDGDVLQVTVTVQSPGQPDFSLTGYRFRYAPRF